MSFLGHQSPRAITVEWLTPPEIIRALGAFDLDPCAPAVRPWDMAAQHYSLPNDGLSLPWSGRVWMNPPYGREADRWLARLAQHGDGIALVAARTETRSWFANVWPLASAVCFVRGRPHFHRPDGSRAPFNSGFPVALIAYGERNAGALESAGLGVVLRPDAGPGNHPGIPESSEGEVTHE